MKVFLGSSKAIGALQDGLRKVQILRCGSWDYPGIEGDGFDIDESTIDQIVANFQAGEKGPEVPTNLDHTEGTDNGWVKQLWKEGSGTESEIWGAFETTDPKIADRLDDGSLKYSSAELDFAWVNPEACRTNGDCEPRIVLEGLALTNRPYIKGMKPVALVSLSERTSPRESSCGCGCDGGRKKSMPETTTETQVDLSAELAEERRLRELSDRRFADLERDLKAEKRRARLSEIKTKLTGLFETKKIPPVVANRLARLSEALVNSDATRVKLSTKVRLAEGESETDELDVLDEVIDLLQQMPEGLMQSDKDDAELSEDESDEDSKDQDSKMKAAEKAANDRVTKDPSVKFSEAYAQELKKRGFTSSASAERKVR